MSIHPRTYARGFTLIETLVAISILVVAVIVPLRVISQSVKSAQFTREKTVATYLAQEGLELVAEMREERLNNLDTAWTLFSELEGYGSGFDIEPTTGALVACNSTAGNPCKLYFDSTHGSGAYYTHTAVYPASVFVRTVHVRSRTGGAAQVESVVTWSSAYGVTASTTKTVWFYNKYE